MRIHLAPFILSLALLGCRSAGDSSSEERPPVVVDEKQIETQAVQSAKGALGPDFFSKAMRSEIMVPFLGNCVVYSIGDARPSNDPMLPRVVVLRGPFLIVSESRVLVGAGEKSAAKILDETFECTGGIMMYTLGPVWKRWLNANDTAHETPRTR